MGVSGIGGAASLPVSSSLPAPSRPGTGAHPSTGVSAHAGAGPAAVPDGRPKPLEGPPPDRPTHQPEVADKHQREVPKPPPLPPLKGLTVAEIRAMLGVVPLPGATPTKDDGAAVAAAAAAKASRFGEYA